jgi:hypothetical protein
VKWILFCTWLASLTIWPAVVNRFVDNNLSVVYPVCVITNFGLSPSIPSIVSGTVVRLAFFFALSSAQNCPSNPTQSRMTTYIPYVKPGTIDTRENDYRYD